MRILVVGSGGVGSAFAPIAARRGFYEHIVFSDIDEARAQRIVDRYGTGGRFSAAWVDATDAAQVAEAARAHGCDVIMNAADPRFVMPIFQGAFDAGVTYMDMAMSLSEAHPDRPHEEVGKKLGDDQFAMAEAWADRGLLALVGLGTEPGASDVFARYAADHLFSEIDEVGVRDGARATTSRPPSRSGPRSRSA
jgi:saccharopine dehydrogenase-like NADP-dependent oxidoreductase